MEPLHEYQRRAVESIKENKRLALWLEMGMGKTRIVLEAIKELGRPRTLIVAPATVVRNVWKQEAAKWTPDTKVSIVDGDPRKRAARLTKEADVYVISRDNLKWLYGQKTKPYEVLVIDESTSFKNPSTVRFKTIKKLLAQFSRIYILSGTPNANGYIDLWAQYYILDCGIRLGRYITPYKERYFNYRIINGYAVYTTPKKGAVKAITEKIKDITFSLTAADYLQLPEKIDNVIEVQQTEKEKEAYKELKKTYIYGQEVTAQNAAALYQKLAQLAGGFLYTDDGEVINIGTGKLDTVREIVECEPDNVLVFYKYKRDKELLIKDGARIIETTKDIDDWNAGKIHYAAASPEVIGRGNNLQAGGHHIVWYSLPWSLEIYQQANARLYRQGQEHPVTITHLLTEGTIDGEIYKALKDKKVNLDTLLKAVESQAEKGGK